MTNSKNGIYDFTEEIRKALSGLEFEALTAVQQKVIPLVLDQKDVIVTAQTGSGKTAAFGRYSMEAQKRAGAAGSCDCRHAGREKSIAVSKCHAAGCK